MNSFLVFVLIVATFSATVSALPSLSLDEVRIESSLMKVDDSGSETNLDELILKEDSGETGDRFPRVTCDLLSAQTRWISVNHSACAARCLAMRRGYRGGYCSNGICHCRRGHHHHG